MLKKIWNVAKTLGRWTRNIMFLFFIFWTIATLREIKTEISLIQDQNLQAYNVQAQVFSKTIEFVNLVAEYTQKSNDDSVNRDATLANFLNELVTRLQTVDETAINRDKNIAEYVQANEQKPAYEYMKSMIVYLIQQDLTDLEHGSIGTGTVIKVTDNETYILTNKHVCDWAEGSICYVYQDKEKYEISLVKANEVDHDMQVVKTSKVVPNKIAVKGIKDVVQQDKVYCVGNNNGNPFMYSEGTVAGFVRESGDLLVGMPSGPGNSGSGIFTQDGYLTGLLYAGQVFPINYGASLDTSHAICINSKILRLFLAEYFPE